VSAAKRAKAGMEKALTIVQKAVVAVSTRAAGTIFLSAKTAGRKTGSNRANCGM
jgi:hypothetical protein